MNNAALKQEVSEGPDRYLEFTISGSYYNSKKEIVNFDNVKGKIPFCDEENGVGSMHARDRFARKWIKEARNLDGDPKFPEYIQKLRTVHIDDIQETTGTYSFVGKNIKDLTVDEMQELAVAKDLRFIPLPEDGLDLREMRVRAYVAYSEKILHKTVKYQDEKFNFAALPAIRLDASGRREQGLKITNEEILEKEATGAKPVNYGDNDDPRNRFSLEELKEIAKTKNIDHADDVSFDDLYSLLFSAN